MLSSILIPKDLPEKLPKNLQFPLVGSTNGLSVAIDVNKLEKQPDKLLQALLIIKKNAPTNPGFNKELHESIINSFKDKLIEIHNSSNNNTQLSSYHYCKLFLNFQDLLKTEEDTDKLITQILDFFKKIHSDPSDLKNLKRGEKLIECLRGIESLKIHERLRDLFKCSEITIPSEEGQPFKITNGYRWARILTFRQQLFGQFQTLKDKKGSFSLKLLQILDQFLLTNALFHDMDTDTLSELYSLAVYLSFDDLIRACVKRLIDEFRNEDDTLSIEFIEFFRSVLKDDLIANKILFGHCLRYLFEKSGIDISLDGTKLNLFLEGPFDENRKSFFTAVLPEMQFNEVAMCRETVEGLLETNLQFQETIHLQVLEHSGFHKLTYEEFDELGKHFPQTKILEIPEFFNDFGRQLFSNWNDIRNVLCYNDEHGSDLQYLKKQVEIFCALFPNLSPDGVLISHVKTICCNKNHHPETVILSPVVIINPVNKLITDYEVSHIRKFIHCYFDFKCECYSNVLKKSFSRYAQINFNGCKNITGEWLFSLNEHQKKFVKHLDIRGCKKITPERIESLKKILPNCTVLHDELPSKKRALEAPEENPSPYKKQQHSNGKDEIID